MAEPYRENIGLVPGHMRAGIIEWIERGIPGGGFMMAVLRNDLMDAFGRADSTNKSAMQDWAAYLYNYAPHNCHGSPEAVHAWREKGGLGIERQSA